MKINVIGYVIDLTISWLEATSMIKGLSLDFISGELADRSGAGFFIPTWQEREHMRYALAAQLPLCGFK